MKQRLIENLLIHIMRSDSPLFCRRLHHLEVWFWTIILAGVTSLSTNAAIGTNLYSPYPQVSNIVSGISWPTGLALPTFATPAAPLDTILVQDLTPDEEITFSALQGLINKTRPRIYLLDSGADEGTYTWANTSLVGFTSRTLYNNANRYTLIAKYTNEVAGVVLYDPSDSIHYRNLASTVAGLSNAIPVTPAIRAALASQGINFAVVVDLTTLPYTTPVDIYNHLYGTYVGSPGTELEFAL